MRNLILILAVFFSLSIFSQNSSDSDFIPIDSAKFVATYSLTYKLDSLNLDNIRNQEMWLFLGKNTSYFVSKSYHLDMQALSKLKTHAEVQLWIDKTSRNYKPRSNYFIYKNYPKGKITFIQHTLDGTFKYEETLDAIHWELTQDTATIGGYHSQKAICDFGGRRWTAWFCAGIPFNDGPYKFNGLPGFIVKIYDSRNHYVFELISIEVADPDLMITIRDKSYIETTKQKYLRAREAMRDGILNIIRQRSSGDDASQQRAAKRWASRNNYVELK